ncbi:hypothetical protein LZC13_10690, partial [Campylobacter coli]|nr:hypothetical protein [Campylobacter coli]
PGCGCAGVVCSFSAPVSQPFWPLSGRISNYLSVQILQATSLLHFFIPMIGNGFKADSTTIEIYSPAQMATKPCITDMRVPLV